MTYPELFENMKQAHMVSDDWRNLLKLLEEELKPDDSEISEEELKPDDGATEAASAGRLSAEDSDKLMKLFTLYFSRMGEGHVYLSTDSEGLKSLIEKMVRERKAEQEEEEEEKQQKLDEIRAALLDACECAAKLETCSLVGENRLFVLDKNRVFTRKHWLAKERIVKKADELFPPCSREAEQEFSETERPGFDYKNVVENHFRLSEGQESVIQKGICHNLLVTGGPGTGKTTSVFFLLLALLHEDPTYRIYLTAPSGKAASRVKESILRDSAHVTNESERGGAAFKKLTNSEEYTIHRLLGFDRNNNGFVHNAAHPFAENSIFVIDEASMIDINLFAALLDAIPLKARVFILGDKDQLPSVECGAVFGELLKLVPQDNIVELTESQRFHQDSVIYKLANAINTGADLESLTTPWLKANQFKIQTLKDESFPIFCYEDPAEDQRKIIEGMIGTWFDAFYKELPSQCKELTAESNFEGIMAIAENARILSALNGSMRGTRSINKWILKNCFRENERVSGYCPGEILMITRNNKLLDLYNGDCGVTVQFRDDETMYIMFKKQSRLYVADGHEENMIFRLGDFMFYPARMIARDEITEAFAITIHKSQGSDYKNILIILPTNPDHPLLNRQIVYTAITRTKGVTYLLSTQAQLNAAKDKVLIRDTGIMS